MSTVIISAMPGYHQKEPGRTPTSTVIELLGENLGRTKSELRTLGDIRDAVQTFGADVASRHPNRSFYISVSIVQGSRKPNGFDKADKERFFGQEDWMQTITKEPPTNRASPQHAA